jgi:hypothetical protein
LKQVEVSVVVGVDCEIDHVEGQAIAEVASDLDSALVVGLSVLVAFVLAGTSDQTVEDVVGSDSGNIVGTAVVVVEIGLQLVDYRLEDLAYMHNFLVLGVVAIFRLAVALQCLDV